jgi:hypothetical protein
MGPTERLIDNVHSIFFGGFLRIGNVTRVGFHLSTSCGSDSTCIHQVGGTKLRHCSRPYRACSFFIHLPLKMEPVEGSETSSFRTQTPGNYPKENILHKEHGESIKSRTW